MRPALRRGAGRRRSSGASPTHSARRRGPARPARRPPTRHCSTCRRSPKAESPKARRPPEAPKAQSKRPNGADLRDKLPPAPAPAYRRAAKRAATRGGRRRRRRPPREQAPPSRRASTLWAPFQGRDESCTSTSCSHRRLPSRRRRRALHDSVPPPLARPARTLPPPGSPRSTRPRAASQQKPPAPAAGALLVAATLTAAMRARNGINGAPTCARRQCRASAVPLYAPLPRACRRAARASPCSATGPSRRTRACCSARCHQAACRSSQRCPPGAASRYDCKAGRERKSVG